MSLSFVHLFIFFPARGESDEENERNVDKTVDQKKKYPSYYSKNCVMHPNLFKITFIKTYTFEEFYRYKRPLTHRKTVQYFFQIHSYLLQLLTEKIPRKTDASKACARLKKPCDLG